MKKVIFLILFLFGLFIIGNFTISIYTLWHKKDLLIIARKELQREEEKNKALKKEFVRVKSQEFVEEEARNKLFMVKPGENTVVIPTTVLHDAVIKKTVKKPEKPTWQQWWELFFH